MFEKSTAAAPAPVDELQGRIENFEDAMVQSISNGETAGMQEDLQTQQTCMLSAVAYGTAVLVLRAKQQAIANGGN